MDALGVERLFQEALPQLCNAAFIDDRVLWAHHQIWQGLFFDFVADQATARKYRENRQNEMQVKEKTDLGIQPGKRHIMAFKNMPPANIKGLLEKMETIMVEAGDVIVNQGEPGDYYYVLTEGEAMVTRMVELATLEPGASFGEEALVSGATRNATVTMKSDGLLMRLSKEDFNALLKDPLLDRVTPDDARARINKGAVWLDVRHAKEFAHSRLPKSINIPLHEMRIRMEELDKKKHYVCVCSTGRRSSAAAFLLVQNGFQASVLNGGLKIMAQDLQQ